ncbi:hypothetical protein HYX11_04725 [Candidatus Woesearchaeota archaeon]|nr:hypothetical protein [Candidatus Woesearchaeota archaeon]
MSLEITITSERKGSNPGGKCSISIYGLDTSSYIKYCNLSHLHDSYLTAQHQPFYEAITLALCQRLGLIVPSYYIIINNKRKIKFNYTHSMPKLSEDKPYYFASELITLPEQEDQEELHQALMQEKIYRDLLLISDVSGKKQNFAYFEHPSPHVLYIDVGCSFVDSVNGILNQRNGKKINLSKQELKNAHKLAERYDLYTNHKTDIMSIDDIINLLPCLELPTLNPAKTIIVEDILSTQEIEEIQLILLANIPSFIKKHKESPNIVDTR